MIYAIIFALPAAVVFGIFIGDATSRTFWLDHHYCPTCDRLSAELEGWVRAEFEEGA